MGSLLSLYFLHPFSNRLANKTQRFNPRYKLTNPTKTPPSPFVFSLLSVILLHLHYTLQSPFSLCYYPLFSCYSVSSSSVTTPCSHVTLSPHTLSPLSSPSVTTPRSHVILSPHTLSPLSSSSVTTPVLMLPCLLIPCPPLSSSPVTIPCSFVTLSPHLLLLSPVPLLLCLLLPCLSSPHPLLLSLVPLLLCPPFTLSLLPVV